MEQARGRITTFYSYKGGTGRSMALANFAWIVAASGKRVLAIDWDLEAPGLHRYFRPFLVDPDLFETDGLIDTFWSFAASAFARAPSAEKRTALEDGDATEEALEDATRRLDWKFSTGGYIDFIGAGRQDGTYSQRVNTFDWKRFYEVGGAHVLTAAKKHLRTRYDWVLIDSRTGVSDTSGICTIQMPETVVAYFTLNRQSIDGVTAILRSIRAFRSASVDGSAINFFPIATRIENAEADRLEVARGYARAALLDFLPKVMQSRQREYWDKMEISYRPAYAFEEILAAFGDATGATGAADTMLSQVEATAQGITGDETLRMPEIVEADRARVLAKYAFGALPVAAKKPHTGHDAVDIEFLRSVRAKEQLWRMSRFRWRRLMSRRELDLLTDEDRKGFGRNMAFYLVQSERMQRLLRITNIAGPVTLVLAAAAVSGFFGIRTEWFVKYRPSLDLAMKIIYSFLGVWMFLVVVISGIVVRDEPYGVRLPQVLSLVLAGPLRRDIRDYEPDEEVTPPGPSRSVK
jgi:MinD-like ATPase involved in chromosome partitioning or flagellar assembly